MWGRAIDGIKHLLDMLLELETAWVNEIVCGDV